MRSALLSWLLLLQRGEQGQVRGMLPQQRRGEVWGGRMAHGQHTRGHR